MSAGIGLAWALNYSDTYERQMVREIGRVDLNPDY